MNGLVEIEKKISPFESFVSSIFERRQEAKKKGEMLYVLYVYYNYINKLLMNSLYGGFGINPKQKYAKEIDRSSLV